MDRRTLLAALPAAAALIRARPGVAAEPMRQGFSPQRLARIRTFLEKGVADRKMAGAVWRIDRRGQLADQGAVGLADIESGRPMTPDAIFRVYERHRVTPSSVRVSGRTRPAGWRSWT